MTDPTAAGTELGRYLRARRGQLTPGLSLITYWASPGSPEHDSLILLDRIPLNEPNTELAENPTSASTD